MTTNMLPFSIPDTGYKTFTPMHRVRSWCNLWSGQGRFTMLDSGPVTLAATLTPKQAANRKWSECAAPAVCPQT